MRAEESEQVFIAGYSLPKVESRSLRKSQTRVTAEPGAAMKFRTRFGPQ